MELSPANTVQNNHSLPGNEFQFFQQHHFYYIKPSKERTPSFEVQTYPPSSRKAKHKTEKIGEDRAGGKNGKLPDQAFENAEPGLEEGRQRGRQECCFRAENVVFVCLQLRLLIMDYQFTNITCIFKPQPDFPLFFIHIYKLILLPHSQNNPSLQHHSSTCSASKSNIIIPINMRRIDNKQNIRRHAPRRMMSHNHLHYKPTQTIAEINHVSTNHRHKHQLNTEKPYRITLPDYFNIPKFEDNNVIEPQDTSNQKEIIKQMQAEIEVRRKLKDLQILAEGMRRAKNIKQQSRYYYTQGVLLHNSQLYKNSLPYFQKFLKIVLFIRDEKSVELALNTIGIEYMLLKNYDKAIEYHRKQGEANARADQFVSRINQGLCYELNMDFESALNEYRQAEQKLKLEGEQQRKRYVKKVIERVDKKVKNLFITTQVSGRPAEKQRSERRDASPLNKSSSVGRFRDEQKVELAISFAQEKMGSFMEQMKNSFLQQKK